MTYLFMVYTFGTVLALAVIVPSLIILYRRKKAREREKQAITGNAAMV